MSFLGGCLRVRSLERSHRNHGNHRKDYFLVAYGKKSLEEIFLKMLLRKKSIIGI